MNRILEIGGILLLVVGVSFGSKSQGPKDEPPPQPKPAKAAPAKGGVPKQQPIPKGAARLVNPSPAARLFRMSPEEREHALEKLPTEQARENARKHEQETGEAPVLDADFADDVAEIIRNRKPWNPPAWD